MDLDLTPFHQYIKISKSKGQRYIYGFIRKKQLVLQPEELVRQAWIAYLTRNHDWAMSNLSVEKSIKIGEGYKRYDLVYYQKGNPAVLFEFKSYKESINENVAQQIAHYNLVLKVPYLVISNGVAHYVFMIDVDQNKYIRQSTLPLFNTH